ncbi:MAG: RNA polymerase sigma factor [Oscillospiraceae bacterium]|nr:RNA polymerase sigma factor [Oscillospiraceae bacterium]
MERKKLIKLVTDAQSGDSKAVDALFNAYYNDVYYFALKTAKDEETACEVTQDTFVAILKNIKDLKEPAAFVTWMKQIAYNHCARFFQKKKDVLVEEDEEGNTVFDALPEERTEFVPDEALDQEDFRKTIMGMLDELSPEQRSATMLYYYSEMSVKTYISDKGQERNKVSNDNLYLIIPPNCNACTHYDFTTYPVNDLYDQVYLSNESEVWLISRDSDESIKLISKASNVKLDASAEYLYYIYDSEELRRAKISDGDRASQTCKVIVDDHAFDYVVTSDGGLVYFVEDDTLYSVDGKIGGTRTRIADDVDSGYLAISSEDVICYISEGDAYVYMAGKTPSRVRRDTVYLVSSPNGHIYAKANDGSYYLPVQEKIAQDERENEAYQELVDMKDRAY